MQTITLNIKGMTCGHCVAAVTEALEHVPGVESAQVELQSGQAIVQGQPEVQALIEAVKDAGYDAAPRPT